MKYCDTQKFNYYLYVLYAVIIFVCVNILNFSWFSGFNFDVTQEKRFDVSVHSLKIIDKIPEQVDLKVYISTRIFTQMPTMKSYVDRVQDFLKQLEKHSDGRLNVTTILVEPFSEQEDQAIALGLQAVPIKDGEGIFLGIIAENMIDGEGVIPFLSPEREAFIEYDIARLIQGVIQTDKVKIAVTSSLPLDTGSGGTTGVLNGKSNPYYTFQSLQTRYDLIGLSPDYKELLDKDNRPKIALILHPRPLTKQANEALRHYMATGGRALIVVDPFSEALPLPIGVMQQNAEIYSDMPEFFKLIGLSYDNNIIVIDRNLARKTVNQQTSHLDEYLAWLKLTPDNFSLQNPTMMSIKELSFSTAGMISRDTQYTGNLTFTPLIYALKKADSVTRETMIGLKNIAELGNNYTPKTPYNLGMLVTGKLPPVAEQNTEHSTEHTNTADMAVIVVSDSDFLDDRLWLQSTNTGEIKPFADNVNLLLNYVDYLAGDDALIALRGKKATHRPLDYLENIKQKAEQTFIIQEKKLNKRIEKLHRDIANIEKNYSGASHISPPEKIKQEIEKFSKELIISRKQLREVRRHVNLDIQNSERSIKLINMIIVPLCFGVLALLILLARRVKAKSLKSLIFLKQKSEG